MSIKLFSLYASLGLDASGFDKGAKSAVLQGKSLASSISDSISTISAKTVALGNAMYDVGKQIFQMGKSAVKSVITEYADTEQLVGGVETLFKNSAQTVMDASANAFKTAGMSANEYMETVTSFSASLLQGLEGDTAQAASVADMAIQDMSDNANKMGTSMTMIQNAYQGFAKDNFTMLDNLKLGYGGTAEEMARLINDSGVLGKTLVNARNVSAVPLDKMFKAIHIIQTEMDITGTTAKEAASTISGSFNAFNAAWKNLLSGMASDQDVDKLMDDLFDTGETMVTNVLNLLPRIGKNVINGVDSLLEKWDFYALLKNAYNVGGWDAVWDAATATVKRKLGEWSTAALETGASFTANLISGITGEEVSSEEVAAKATEIFSAFGSAATDVVATGETLLADLFAAINKDGESPGLIGNKISGVFDAGFTAMGSLVTTAGTLLSDLYKAISDDTEGAANLEAFFSSLGGSITTVGSGFGAVLGGMVDGYTVLFQEIGSKWETFRNEDKDLFEFLKLETPTEEAVNKGAGGTGVSGGQFVGAAGVSSFLKAAFAAGTAAVSKASLAGLAGSLIAGAITPPEVEYYEPPENETYEKLKEDQERTETNTVLKSQNELLKMLGNLGAGGHISEDQYYDWADTLWNERGTQEYIDIALEIEKMYEQQRLLEQLYRDIEINPSDATEASPIGTDNGAGDDISGVLERFTTAVTSFPDAISAALSGISVEMDGVIVGNLVLPTVSAGIARMNRTASKTATA